MIIYRLANARFSHDISGNGAKLYGGRWNSPGNPLLYGAENISLTILEILVRADKTTRPLSYQLIKIEVQISNRIAEIKLDELNYNWQFDLKYTQHLGDKFLQSNVELILKLPSAIVPQEHNFIVNPLHKDFSKVVIVESVPFPLDERLFIK